jgi:peroxiredoxin Q/BCP
LFAGKVKNLSVSLEYPVNYEIICISIRLSGYAIQKCERNKKMLNVGDKAPEFTLPDQNEKMHQLSGYRGKWVVLYFYPKDSTPGCTTEACSFRDEHPQFDGLNAVVLGVSKDSVASHAKFAGKYELPFTLISDKEGTVCEDYGVWQEKSLYGRKFMGIVRSSFIINPEGNIAAVYPKVKVKEHTAEVLADLKALQG